MLFSADKKVKMYDKVSNSVMFLVEFDENAHKVAVELALAECPLQGKGTFLVQVSDKVNDYRLYFSYVDGKIVNVS